MRKIDPYYDEIAQKMMRCREPGERGLGYHKYVCPEHPNEYRIVPHTCKTKICTTCAALQNQEWSEDMKARFPDVPYLHVTLTMPEEFRSFYGEEDDQKWSRKNALYELGWKSVNGFLSHKKVQGGGLVVLHTFGRALNVNPHLHIILPAGGVKKNKDGTYEWKEVLHIAQEYLSKAWKKNLLGFILENTPELSPYKREIPELLRKPNTETETRLIQILRKSCPSTEYEEVRAWENKWLKVFQVKYYVNVKKKKQYEQTVCYVARYTRRLPIAKSRAIAWDPETQMLTWRYDPHNEPHPVDTTMHVYRFFDLIFQHIPPKYFRTIRYYGIFSNKNTKHFHSILETVCRFNQPERHKTWAERILEFTGEHPLVCSCCGAPMTLCEKAHLNTSGKMQYEKVKVYNSKKLS